MAKKKDLIDPTNNATVIDDASMDMVKRDNNNISSLKSAFNTMFGDEGDNQFNDLFNTSFQEKLDNNWDQTERGWITDKQKDVAWDVTEYGKSKYDSEYQPYWNDKDVDLEDRRSKQQWGITQLGLGLLHCGTVAVTSSIGGLLGLAYGIPDAIINGDLSKLYDNDVSNAFDDLEQKIEDISPTYRSKESRINDNNGQWYKNLGTSAFWGDTVLKNAGYALGAYVTGGASAAMTGAIQSSKLARLAAAAGKSAKGFDAMKEIAIAEKQVANAEKLKSIYDLQNAKEVVSGVTNAKKLEAIEQIGKQKGLSDEIIQAAKQGKVSEQMISESEKAAKGARETIATKGKEIEKADEYYNRYQRSTGIRANITNTAISSVGESSMEGRNAKKDYINEQMERINKQYNDAENNAQTLDEYNQAYWDYKKAKEEIENRGSIIGNLTFAGNMAVLSGSEMFQYGRAFKRLGTKTSEDITERNLRSSIGKYIGKGEKAVSQDEVNNVLNRLKAKPKENLSVEERTILNNERNLNAIKERNLKDDLGGDFLNNKGVEKDLKVEGKLGNAKVTIGREIPTTKLGKFLQGGSAFLKNGLAEGNEEMLQSFIPATFNAWQGGDVNVQSYIDNKESIINNHLKEIAKLQGKDSIDKIVGLDDYKKQFDYEGRDKAKDFAHSCLEGWNNSYGDANTWQEGFVGAITGMFGMPAIGKSAKAADLQIGDKFGWNGGWATFASNNKYNEQLQKGAEQLKAIFNSPEKVKQIRNIVAQNSFSNLLDEYTKKGQDFERKNTELASVMSDITTLNRLGKLDTWLQMFNDTMDVSELSDLKQFLKETTTDESLSPYLYKGGKPIEYKDDNGNVIPFTKDLIDKLDETKDSDFITQVKENINNQKQDYIDNAKSFLDYRKEFEDSNIAPSGDNREDILDQMATWKTIQHSNDKRKAEMSQEILSGKLKNGRTLQEEAKAIALDKNKDVHEKGNKMIEGNNRWLQSVNLEQISKNTEENNKLNEGIKKLEENKKDNEKKLRDNKYEQKKNEVEENKQEQEKKVVEEEISKIEKKLDGRDENKLKNEVSDLQTKLANAKSSLDNATEKTKKRRQTHLNVVTKSLNDKQAELKEVSELTKRLEEEKKKLLEINDKIQECIDNRDDLKYEETMLNDNIQELNDNIEQHTNKIYTNNANTKAIRDNIRNSLKKFFPKMKDEEIDTITTDTLKAKIDELNNNITNWMNQSDKDLSDLEELSQMDDISLKEDYNKFLNERPSKFGKLMSTLYTSDKVVENMNSMGVDNRMATMEDIIKSMKEIYGGEVIDKIQQQLIDSNKINDIDNEITKLLRSSLTEEGVKELDEEMNKIKEEARQEHIDNIKQRLVYVLMGCTNIQDVHKAMLDVCLRDGNIEQSDNSVYFEVIDDILNGKIEMPVEKNSDGTIKRDVKQIIKNYKEVSDILSAAYKGCVNGIDSDNSLNVKDSYKKAMLQSIDNIINNPKVQDIDSLKLFLKNTPEIDSIINANYDNLQLNKGYTINRLSPREFIVKVIGDTLDIKDTNNDIAPLGVVYSITVNKYKTEDDIRKEVQKLRDWRNKWREELVPPAQSNDTESVGTSSIKTPQVPISSNPTTQQTPQPKKPNKSEQRTFNKFKAVVADKVNDFIKTINNGNYSSIVVDGNEYNTNNVIISFRKVKGKQQLRLFISCIGTKHSSNKSFVINNLEELNNVLYNELYKGLKFKETKPQAPIKPTTTWTIDEEALKRQQEEQKRIQEELQKQKDEEQKRLLIEQKIKEIKDRIAKLKKQLSNKPYGNTISSLSELGLLNDSIINKYLDILDNIDNVDDSTDKFLNNVYDLYDKLNDEITKLLNGENDKAITKDDIKYIKDKYNKLLDNVVYNTSSDNDLNADYKSFVDSIRIELNRVLDTTLDTIIKREIEEEEEKKRQLAAQKGNQPPQLQSVGYEIGNTTTFSNQTGKVGTRRSKDIALSNTIIKQSGGFIILSNNGDNNKSTTGTTMSMREIFSLTNGKELMDSKIIPIAYSNSNGEFLDEDDNVIELNTNGNWVKKGTNEPSNPVIVSTTAYINTNKKNGNNDSNNSVNNYNTFKKKVTINISGHALRNFTKESEQANTSEYFKNGKLRDGYSLKIVRKINYFDKSIEFTDGTSIYIEWNNGQNQEIDEKNFISIYGNGVGMTMIIKNGKPIQKPVFIYNSNYSDSDLFNDNDTLKLPNEIDNSKSYLKTLITNVASALGISITDNGYEYNGNSEISIRELNDLIRSVISIHCVNGTYGKTNVNSYISVSNFSNGNNIDISEDEKYLSNNNKIKFSLAVVDIDNSTIDNVKYKFYKLFSKEELENDPAKCISILIQSLSNSDKGKLAVDNQITNIENFKQTGRTRQLANIETGNELKTIVANSDIKVNSVSYSNTGSITFTRIEDRPQTHMGNTTTNVPTTINNNVANTSGNNVSTTTQPQQGNNSTTNTTTQQQSQPQTQEDTKQENEQPSTQQSNNTSEEPQQLQQPQQQGNSVFGNKVGGGRRKRTPKNRIVNDNYNKANINKELKWLFKRLPQTINSTMLVNGLIEAASYGSKAWGQYCDGMMKISTLASEGTVFHESFHYVFNSMLNEYQRKDLYNEAKEKYNIKRSDYNNNEEYLIELEEKMADDFMDFVLEQQKEEEKPFSSIRAFFKMLINAIRHIFNGEGNNNTKILKLFNSINNGKLANNNNVFYRNNRFVSKSEIIANYGNTSKIYSNNINPKNTWDTLNNSMIDDLINHGWSKEMFSKLNMFEQQKVLECA